MPETPKDWADEVAARCQERHAASVMNDSMFMPCDLGERIAAALRAARDEWFKAGQERMRENICFAATTELAALLSLEEQPGPATTVRRVLAVARALPIEEPTP